MGVYRPGWYDHVSARICPSAWPAAPQPERPVRVARPDGTPIPNRLVDPAHNVQPSWLRLFQDFSDRFVIGADEFIGPSGTKARIAASFDPTWAMLGQLPKALAEKTDSKEPAQVVQDSVPNALLLDEFFKDATQKIAKKYQQKVLTGIFC